ncbi:MAG TPA: hypothetical protein VGI16_11335 [Candidatus Acidoferrum sp.]|jgi:hypothetical protein
MRYDIGGDICFRLKGIEACNGESARNAVLEKLKEFFDEVRFGKVWFEDSVGQPKK